MAKNISLITSVNSGMRRFGINYAYYLRRSCVYRPCNEKLEQIMQVLLSDECFPYSRGGNGSWEACRDAVQELKDQ